MRSTARWVGVVLVTACGGGESAPQADSLGAATMPAVEEPLPMSVAEIAPGDTGAIVGLMRRAMSSGDEALGGLERRDTTLSDGADQAPRQLTLWLENGMPAKLAITEPTETGALLGETAVWFVNGEVRVVQEPFAAFLFEADRLVLWTDETLVPLDVPEAERATRAAAVLDTVRARLGVFGVGYP